MEEVTFQYIYMFLPSFRLCCCCSSSCALLCYPGFLLAALFWIGWCTCYKKPCFSFQVVCRFVHVCGYLVRYWCSVYNITYVHIFCTCVLHNNPVFTHSQTFQVSRLFSWEASALSRSSWNKIPFHGCFLQCFSDCSKKIPLS